MRRPVIAGNWKMYNTVPEALSLVRQLKKEVAAVSAADIVVAPAFTALAAVAAELQGSNIALSAQNLHWEQQGAFTGEVSAAMLKDVGCSHAIIGHSERRQFFGETNATVNKKTRAALSAGLTPIVCVGETLDERESGRTMELIARQIREGLALLPPAEISGLIIAYEPVWAIGTGKTATPGQAEEVHASIRDLLAEIGGKSVAEELRILYGGSVKADNVDELMRQPDIDGALVGGASLKADSFARIVKFQR